MRFRTLVTMLLTVTTFISISHAHPGRTDSKGGHYNRSTGEYHYHHGYSAHQHTNGECPYDFDDRTGWNSGSSSSGSGKPQTVTTIKPVSSEAEPSVSKGDPINIWVILRILFWGAVCTIGNWDTRRKRKPPTLLSSEPLPLNEPDAAAKEAEFQARRLAQEQHLKEMRHRQELRREEERRQQEQQYEEARAFALNYYAGKTTKECAGMPDRFEMGTDRLPREIGSARWGSTFTFYTSPSGRSYHCKRGCSSAKLPIHAYHCAKSKNPCKRCNPVLPDMSWYDRYWVVVEDKKKFGIPDFVPPSEKTKEENGVERL